MMKYLKTKMAGMLLAVVACSLLGAYAINMAQKSTKDGISMIVEDAIAQSGPAGNINALTPLTRDIGAILKPASAGAGVYTSSDQTGYNVTRVVCVLNQSAISGAPTSTISIQNKDIASGQYYGVASSAAATAANAPVYTAIGGDLNASGGSQIASIPVASKWHVLLYVASQGAAVTGTVGCSVQ